MEVCFSPSLIDKNALEGKYYHQGEWKRVDFFERVWRTVLSIFFFHNYVDGVELSCRKRSWQVIEKGNEIPDDFQKHITGHFEESAKKDLRDIPILAAQIYARIYQSKNGKEFPHYFEIQQQENKRIFHAGQTGKMINTDYAEWHLYAGQKESYVSKHDDLLSGSEVVARVNEVSYTPQHLDNDWEGTRSKKYAVLEGEGSYAPQFTLCREYDFTFHRPINSDVFFARDRFTNQIMAVAIWSNNKFQKWSVTLTKPHFWEHGKYSVFENKGDKIDLLIWALLKHSQKHMPGVKEYPYPKKDL